MSGGLAARGTRAAGWLYGPNGEFDLLDDIVEALRRLPNIGLGHFFALEASPPRFTKQ